MMDNGDHRVSKWQRHYGAGKDAAVSGAERESGEKGATESNGFRLSLSLEDGYHPSDTSANISQSHAGLQPVRSSARTSGREIDMMYAEYLASSK
jgi:hypothetical protein